MNKVKFISGLSIVSAAIGLATFSGDASAYTRSVCAIAGIQDNAANWTTGNCAAHNVSSTTATLRFPIPADSLSDISAGVFLQGSALAPGAAQLITFNKNLYYRTGTVLPTAGATVSGQWVFTESLAMSGDYGTAVVLATVQPNTWVYNVQIDN